MATRAWLLIPILSCLACGGAQHPRTAPGESGWYALQFTGARLDARRADGSPWHTRPGDRTALIIGGVLGLAAGNPALGMAIGEAASDPGGDPLAPEPFIDLKIEGETYRIAPVGRTYAPSWQQPIALDVRDRRGDERVILQIRDAVNGSTIAQHELTLAELLAKPAQTFTRLGAVMSLDLTVTPMPPRRPAEYRVIVPATLSIEELTRRGAPGWHPIPVWNGDTVTIQAGGDVCPSSRDECFGPGGAKPGRWQSYSYLKHEPHASLVAAVPAFAAGVPGEALGIGVGRTFQLAQSGRILLFVNDDDVDNNAGAFDVRVTVTPPN
jgi:hypothetical protein